MTTISLRRPDDWHLHLRDGAQMAAVLPFTSARFARALVMPNLRPPVTTTAQARAYRERILASLPSRSRFEPLLTLICSDWGDAFPDLLDSGILRNRSLRSSGTGEGQRRQCACCSGLEKIASLHGSVVDVV